MTPKFLFMDIKNKPIVIFDLDDTLFNELDYLKSAFSEIAKHIATEINSEQQTVFDDMLSLYHNNANVFAEILERHKTGFGIQDLLHIYRHHEPSIQLLEDRNLVLDNLKSKGIKMGLLSDGRSLQQRNKIKALHLNDYFEEIIISEEFGSEKPNENNYLYFQSLYGEGDYFYIGDNVSKDFVSPNKLGWTSICILDNGNNIHKQDFNRPSHYLPSITLKNFKDLIELLNS